MIGVLSRANGELVGVIMSNKSCRRCTAASSMPSSRPEWPCLHSEMIKPWLSCPSSMSYIRPRPSSGCMTRCEKSKRTSPNTLTGTTWVGDIHACSA
jgi:hypothetical protein